MNRKTSLLLGYARRMQEVARLATEMKEIQTTYTREFGKWTTEQLTEVLAGQKLAGMYGRLAAAQHPLPADRAAEDVLEPVVDTALAGSAPGGVPVFSAGKLESIVWDHKLTDQEIARRMGPNALLGLKKLNSWRKGVREPSVAEMHALAAILEVSFDDLCDIPKSAPAPGSALGLVPAPGWVFNPGDGRGPLGVGGVDPSTGDRLDALPDWPAQEAPGV